MRTKILPKLRMYMTFNSSNLQPVSFCMRIAHILRNEKFEHNDIWRIVNGEEMSCDWIPESTRRQLQMCPECIDEGNTFIRYDLSCKLSAENAEKKRKAEEKERECDRQATEKRNQCLTQPAPGSSLRIDGAQLGGMGPKPD